MGHGWGGFLQDENRAHEDPCNGKETRASVAQNDMCWACGGMPFLEQCSLRGQREPLEFGAGGS